MNTENPFTAPLDNRKAMLETLHMAYQFALDFVVGFNPPSPRLTDEQHRELGRRLALYWVMNPRSDAVATALEMVAESNARMNTYTAAQRAELEKEGRAIAAKDTVVTP